jgi:hypothetical protein
MCACIIEFGVVLFKMLSCNALSVVSGTCLFADCYYNYNHMRKCTEQHTLKQSCIVFSATEGYLIHTPYIFITPLLHLTLCTLGVMQHMNEHLCYLCVSFSERRLSILVEAQLRKLPKHMYMISRVI